MAIRPGSSEQRIIFWLGCHVLRHSDIIQSCVSLLRLMGADVRTAAGGKYCCGTIKDMNLTAADALGKNVSSRFNATKRDEVVSYCPSCQTHMDNFVSEANETHFNASHFVSFLHRHRKRGRLRVHVGADVIFGSRTRWSGRQAPPASLAARLIFRIHVSTVKTVHAGLYNHACEECFRRATFSIGPICPRPSCITQSLPPLT